jgi:hypothetical protein
MTTNRLDLPADEIVTNGKHLGRFRWNEYSNGNCHTRTKHGDWLPDPNGTALGFVYRSAFFIIPSPQGYTRPVTIPQTKEKPK